MRNIGILGAGGMARETSSYSLETVEFFAVSKEYIKSEDDSKFTDISSPTEKQRKTSVVAALGAPAVRMAMLNIWPGNNYATVIAPSAQVYSKDIGQGVIIAPGAIITTDVTVGMHSIINIGATISHDCKIGEFVTVSPGAHIAGGVELGDGVFVGIGAVVSNEVKIADGVVIGAGAVVVHDIEECNTVVTGIPARPIRINKGWMHEV